MSLSSVCRDSFDSTTRLRGEAYHRIGRVHLAEDYGDCIHAMVHGGEKRPYEVYIDWERADDGVIEATCSCPRYASGFLCKHLWAAILAIDEDSEIEVSLPSDHFDVMHDDDEDDADMFAGLATGMKRAPQSKTPTPDWKSQLAQTSRQTRRDPPRDWAQRAETPQGKRELWYLIDVAESRQTGRLWVYFEQRQIKKDGTPGKPSSALIRRDGFSDLIHQTDREVVPLLLGNDLSEAGGGSAYYYQNTYGGRAYNRIALTPEMYELVLPRLAATGRLIWLLDHTIGSDEARPVAWDDGPAWQFRLDAETIQDEQKWRITGCLSRGDETVALNEPILMLAHGVVLFSDRIGRLDASADFPWIAQLRRTDSIEIPFDQREAFLEQFWKLNSVPRHRFPEDLQPTANQTEPVGRLVIQTPKVRNYGNHLFANIFFVYGDSEFRWNDPAAGCYDANSHSILSRSPASERRLLSDLAALRLLGSTSYPHEKYDARITQRSFPELVQRLAMSGWIVESDGRRIRRPGAMNLSVKSNVDWFELQGKVDFGGASATLPALLSAVRNNDKYVRLDDGSHGMLPEDWLAQFGGLAALGQVDDEVLKFAPSQALLLDALLAEQDNASVDRDFDKFREKLRSFSGVDAGREPRGFAGQLRGYQREGLGWINFLRDFRFGGCLADDMGLGKTVQVLALLQSRRIRRLRKDETRYPSLVVVPKSLVFNWIDEATRFAPRLRVINYTGMNRAGLLDNLNDCDLVVTTYGTLRRDILELKKHRFDYAILDESQAIKNANSQAAKACRLLQADHRLAMTGTPVENHLGELWSLFEFLNPGMLGQSTTFSSINKTARPGDDNDMLPLLAKSLRPFLLRRTKEQVLTELPEKSEQTLICDMPAKQRRLYDELRDHYRASLSKKVGEIGLQRSKIHVLEALLRLRQAACHPGLIDQKLVGDPSAKLEVLLEQIEEVVEEGHKALVFSQFTSLLSIVRDRLDKQNISYEYLDGKTRKRKDKVDRFQSDDSCQLFLISLKAGGHGLNLTAADYVFILDPWWNPAVESQAVDRAHRIGQTRRVFAYRLICRDTVEQKILELQKDKRDLADAIISADNSVIRNLTSEDLTLLLS